MAKVVTAKGVMDESDVTWRLWREDVGESWTIIHELRDPETGEVLRRDTWVNFKGVPLPASSATVGEL